MLAQLSDFERTLLPHVIRLRVKWFDQVDMSIAAPSLSVPSLDGWLSSLSFTIERTELEWDTSTVNGTIVHKLLRL